MNRTVDIVLVTFNPNLEYLEKSVNQSITQVRSIIVVDNASSNSEGLKKLLENYHSAQLVSLNANTGIAHAQNLGIQSSIANGSEFILLLDQDTIIPVNYIDRMLIVFSDYENVAVVAPLFNSLISDRENEGFDFYSKFIYKRKYPVTGKHEVAHVIASGMLIQVEAIKIIGGMSEELFIDWVDFEWCWRAQSYNYRVIGNADVTIEHSLGNRNIMFAQKRVGLRNPIRHYYITRNSIHLALRCRDLSFSQRLFLFFKGIRYLVGYSCLASPRFDNLRMTVLGFFHALLGRLGKL